MTVTEPVIVFPGTPVHHVFVVKAEMSPTACLDERTTAMLRDHGIIELQPGTLLDLPPTEIPREPLFWTSGGDLELSSTEALTWTTPRAPQRRHPQLRWSSWTSSTRCDAIETTTPEHRWQGRIVMPEGRVIDRPSARLRCRIPRQRIAFASHQT